MVSSILKLEDLRKKNMFRYLMLTDRYKAGKWDYFVFVVYSHEPGKLHQLMIDVNELSDKNGVEESQIAKATSINSWNKIITAWKFYPIMIFDTEPILDDFEQQTKYFLHLNTFITAHRAHQSNIIIFTSKFIPKVWQNADYVSLHI